MGVGLRRMLLSPPDANVRGGDIPLARAVRAALPPPSCKKRLKKTTKKVKIK